jgi:hypothetical protein
VGRRHPPGQAAVELALALPFLGLLLLAVLQAALVARDQVLVVHAAREGARQAAVDPSPGAARAGAEAAGPLAGGRLDVEARGRGRPGSRVRVTVRYRAPTDVPLVGPLVGDVAVSARAAMRVER